VENETGYRLERSIDGQTWQLVASPAANVSSHSDNGLNTGVTYYYRILATNGAGDSPWSNVTSARTLTPPDAPANLTASGQSSTQINLSWADVTDETSYKVQRSANGTTGWSQVGTTAANVTAFSNTGLSANTTYWYRVVASNASGDSAASTSASATTLGDTIAPTIPTNLKATNGKGKITLTWSASTDTGGSGLNGYKVFRSTTSTGVFTQVGAPTTNSFVNTAPKGSTFWYYVVAVDKAGNTSAASTKVSGRAT
jgi:fibronectin type 3 domain-containing protein